MRYGIANQAGQPTRGEVGRILQTGRSSGINFIDTARSYGDAELIVGELVGDDPFWLVSTKLDGELGDLGDCGSSNLSRLLQAANRSLEISRGQLRRRRLPVVLLHRFEHLTACSGQIWDLVVRERERGSIGRLGVSANGPQEAMAALDYSHVEVIQVPANVADQRLRLAGFFDRARSQGILIVVRSVFLQGALLLAPEHLPPHLAVLSSLLEALDEDARRAGCTRAELLFAHARTLGDVILVGCESEQQLRRDISAWERSAAVADLAPDLVELTRRLPPPVIEPWRWPGASR